jgi:hypothetical protein
MSNKNSSSSSSGIGFFGLLGIAFIVLKIMGYIEWSWLWVLAPIWIPTAIGILILLFVIVIYLLK